MLRTARARRARRRVALRRFAVTTAVATGVAALAGAPLRSSLGGLVGPPGPGRAHGAPGPDVSSAAASALRLRRGVFDVRPRPTAAPRPDPSPEPGESAAGTSIPEVVRAAAAEFGLDDDYLLAVAACESGLDPGATNPAGYHGLFQFDRTTWEAYGYGSIYDPVAQARTAARLLAAGQDERWPNCA